MNAIVIQGDLLDQQTEAIVNPWNQNIIPWWLLIPHGISGAIKKRAGIQPFRELGRCGRIPLGGAVHTSAGRLPYQAIIHVASITLRWHSSSVIIQKSVRNAMRVAEQLGLRSIAFPILGSGSGGFDKEVAEHIMVHTLMELSGDIDVIVVRYSPE